MVGGTASVVHTGHGSEVGHSVVVGHSIDSFVGQAGQSVAVGQASGWLVGLLGHSGQAFVVGHSAGGLVGQVGHSVIGHSVGW